MADGSPRGEAAMASATGVPTQRELSPAFSDASIDALAHELRSSAGTYSPAGGLTFCMLLNIPTTYVATCRAEMAAAGRQATQPVDGSDANDDIECRATTAMLRHWRENLKKQAPEKDMVNDIVRAFTQWGRANWAEIFLTKHAAREELSKGAFADVRGLEEQELAAQLTATE